MLKGIWTAVATPFHHDKSLDWESLERLLEKQCTAGVAGVVLLGSTGEGSLLTPTERLAVIKRSRAVIGHRCQVMAAVSGSETSQAVEMAQLSLQAGADSLLVVTPPYVKATLPGLIHHFQAFSGPLCLYYVPSRTGQTLSPEAMAKLVEAVPSIRAVKEASGLIGFFQKVRQLLPSSVAMLSGDDETFLASLAVGGVGCISVVANLMPRTMIELQQAWDERLVDRAQALNCGLLPLMEALFRESNPGPLKEALYQMGVCATPMVRPPLAVVTEETAAVLRERLSEVVRAGLG